MAYGQPKKIQGATVLKQVDAENVREDGTIHFAKTKVYIEKGGACRMFIEVPAYISATLPHADVSSKLRQNGVTYTASDNRLYGRDPNTLVSGLSELSKLYSDRKTELVLQPKILIQYQSNTRDVSRGYSSHQVELRLSVDRALFEPDNSPRTGGISLGEKIRGTFYKWRNTDADPLERSNYYSSDGGMRMFDYNEDLWLQVTRMRDGFKAGVERLDKIMASKELEQRLLSGNMLMLGSDQ